MGREGFEKEVGVVSFCLIRDFRDFVGVYLILLKMFRVDREFLIFW